VPFLFYYPKTLEFQTSFMAVDKSSVRFKLYQIFTAYCIRLTMSLF